MTDTLAAPRTRTTRSVRGPALDAACAAAIDLARAAAAEEADDASHVGSHVAAVAVDDRLVSHQFVCEHPGYVGWQWSVSVARASRAKVVTVDEVVLLPAEQALVAPSWVPWHERVEPGDLGPGDLLPTEEDDERLVPGFWPEGDLAGLDVDELLEPRMWQLGLGRERVLSRVGQDEAATRWATGDAGPSAPIAKQAPARCSTCGFLLTIGGVFGQAFGVCANRFAPDDGRVVTLDHGCGGHSQVRLDLVSVEVPGTVIDELGIDTLDLGHS